MRDGKIEVKVVGSLSLDSLGAARLPKLTSNLL
jgi:hypothetical protein